jgi:hypothetical protein
MIRNVILFLLLVGLAGCGSNAPATNAALATEVDVLKQALDSWKSGSNPESFTDPDWKAGAKLLEYHVIKAGGEDEGETLCTVLLKLDLRGKPVERTVSYRVTQSPKRSVARLTSK